MINSDRFGLTSIIARADKEAARQVTFAPNVRIRSVTLDGDVYDPAGTLSAGNSRATEASVLNRLDSLRKLELKLSEAKAQLAEVEKELEQSTAAAAEHAKLEKDSNLRKHERSLLQKLVDQSPHAQILREVENLKAQIAAEEQKIRDCQEQARDAADRSKKIEVEIGEFSNHREGKLKSLKVSIIAFIPLSFLLCFKILNDLTFYGASSSTAIDCGSEEKGY
jgi:structural maintenance of chromosome 2